MVKGKKVLKIRAQGKKFSFKYDVKTEAIKTPKGKFYPAEDIVFTKGPVPKRNAPKLRSSLTPGTVVILLAGRFRGKRVVFLKQLKSGLLLVSGPYEINGVPLRRVNQRYVIATTTKVPLDGVNVANIDDELFARAKGEEKSSEGTVTSPSRKAAQAAVDGALTKNVDNDKEKMMRPYLAAKFSMSKADKPHLMKF